MAGSPAVGNDFDDSVGRIPVIAAAARPGISDHRGVRTAVDVHVHRVLLTRIERFRIADKGREGETVPGGHRDELRKVHRTEVHAICRIGDLERTGRFSDIEYPELVRDIAAAD